MLYLLSLFLVYKATKIISKTHEFKWKSNDGKFNNMSRFIKHLVKLCFNFFPVAFVFLVIYMIAALVRGDVSIENVVITDYGYFVGVIITALFFGFRDSSENNRNIESINQKENELKELQSKYRSLEKKHKNVSTSYIAIRNKGKRELAHIEKYSQEKDSKN